MFDPELWRTRATKRFLKASAAGKLTCGVKYNREMKAINDLDVLISWCHKKRIEVNFGRIPSGVYESHLQKIIVNGRLNPESQLFVLLHECGHHLIGDRRADERFGQGYPALTNRSSVPRSMTHRVDVIDEELEAWARGLKLAKRLKIVIDLPRFNRIRTEYVRTYFKWALRVDGYTDSLGVQDGDDQNKKHRDSAAEPQA